MSKVESGAGHAKFGIVLSAGPKPATIVTVTKSCLYYTIGAGAGALPREGCHVSGRTPARRSRPPPSSASQALLSPAATLSRCSLADSDTDMP
eukprot:371928-Rhodomonas_salina.2